MLNDVVLRIFGVLCRGLLFNACNIDGFMGRNLSLVPGMKFNEIYQYQTLLELK